MRASSRASAQTLIALARMAGSYGFLVNVSRKSVGTAK